MELKEILIEINQLKEDLDRLVPIGEDDKSRIEEKVRLEWNYHSNKLEGNELSFGETRELLKNDKTSGKSWKDHREIKGHDEAITYVKEMVREKSDLTEKFIRELNLKVLKESYSKEAVTSNGQPTSKTIYPGEYKSSPNHVKTKTGDVFRFTEPHDVSYEMEKLIEWYKQEDESTHPLILATEFHYRFIRIHPFDDGNGRVVRLLVNYILMKHGYPPIIIKTEEKDSYLSALRKADTGEIEHFYEFMGQCLIKSLELYIKGGRGKDINEFSDLDKRLKVLKTAIEQDDLAEIREKRSIDSLNARFEDSIWPLFEAFVAKMEDFRSLFTEFELGYLIDGTSYSNEKDLSEIKSKFLESINSDSHTRNLGIKIRLNGFKKGGTQPLSTHQDLNIQFQDYLYIVNPDRRGNNDLATMKKLYHQTLQNEDIEKFVFDAGMGLLEQLEAHYNEVRDGRY